MPDPRIWPIPFSSNYNFSVTAVSQICVPSRSRRQDCDITNISDYWVYLARGNDAVLYTGISIAPSGGSYHLGLFTLFLGDIYCISEGQGKALITIEEGYDRPS